MKPVSNTRCPTCRKTGAWLAGEFGPFCSKRCKLIDLGKWLGEEFKVVDHAPELEEDGRPPSSGSDGSGGLH